MTRTETKGERKRTTATKQNTSYSSYLVEEVTPQILSLGSKPLLSLRMPYLKRTRIFKKWFNRFFPCSGMKIENLKCARTNAFFNPFAQLVFDVPRQ